MGESSPAATTISIVSKYRNLDMPRTLRVFPAKPQQYRLILVSPYILFRIGCGWRRSVQAVKMGGFLTWEVPVKLNVGSFSRP